MSDQTSEAARKQIVINLNLEASGERGYSVPVLARRPTEPELQDCLCQCGSKSGGGGGSGS